MITAFGVGTCFRGEAGGSGLNVAVVVNANSSNSMALGDYYSELRQVPAQNVIRMSNWNGGGISWTLAQCRDALIQPLHDAIQSRGLTNQVDYVLLSMDIPYRVTEGGTENSTTSVLYYGFKTNSAAPSPDVPDSCSLPDASSNSWAGSEWSFRSMGPGSVSWTNFLATMITASTLEQAKLALSLGAISDGLFPTNPAVLVKSSDIFRNVRYTSFDNAIFNARVQGVRELLRTNGEGFGFNSTFSGAQAGNYYFNPQSSTFTPGALVDDLTSGSGALFDNSGHVTALDFIEAGASGSYGTLVEPCNYLEKFPSPQVFFYQSRGFNLAESYYMGITNPYQGVLLGDPLAAPFAHKPSLTWSDVPSTGVTGAVQLGLTARGADLFHPVSRVDLYTNDIFMRTLTNIPPRAGNVLSIDINGFTSTYTIPGGATLNSAAAGLASAINSHAQLKNSVKATAHGDRIELQWTDINVAGTDVSVNAWAEAGTAPVLQTFARAEQPAFLDTVAYGIREFKLTGDPTNRWLNLSVTTTNGTVITMGVTNSDTAALTLGGLAQSLVTAVNTRPELGGSDGLVAEDFADYGTTVYFNLRARSAGWKAAQIKARLSGQSGLTPSPQTLVTLEGNLGDLRPRNHVYVGSGALNLPVLFELNTQLLTRGWNKLTAVAIEGSNVRTTTLGETNLLVSGPPELVVSILAPAAGAGGVLRWVATAGKTYTILSSPVVEGPYVAEGSVVAPDVNGSWSLPGQLAGNRFYRIREEQ